MDIMSDDRVVAADFERGWSEERLDAVRSGWGPGVMGLLPENLVTRLALQAKAEGRSSVDLFGGAVEKLLAERHAA